MPLTLPHINLVIEDSAGKTKGKLSLLSLGLGVHLSWMLLAIFATEWVFPGMRTFSLAESSTGFLTYPTLAALLAMTAMHFFVCITDQKLLSLYTSKKMIAICAFICCIGTMLFFCCMLPYQIGSLLTFIGGVFSGIGSAGIVLFWGVAYSRKNAASIVINAAVGTSLALALCTFIIQVLPYPACGIVTAALCILEIPLLFALTPESYLQRHKVPIFNPLPVKKSAFILRFDIPIFLFGIVLGSLRSLSGQVILPLDNTTALLLALFVGIGICVVLIVLSFAIDRNSQWEFLFRPLIPLVVIALFFIPSLVDSESILAPIMLLIGYICLEALLWIFLGQLCRKFRLSPFFVFGFWNGFLTLGSIIGVIGIHSFSRINALIPFGEYGGVMILMIILVIAFSALPRIRDISQVIGIDESSLADQENDEAPASGYSGFEPYSQTLPANKQDASRVQAFATGGYLRSEMANIGGNAQVGDPYSASYASQQTTDSQGSPPLGRFRMQCKTISDRYLLSRRESEVLVLLAKGHNAAYIQDQLCISKSTAKTHISHIYRKLDIHNQQELLSMIDNVRKELHN